MNSKPQGPILLAPRLACNPIVLGAELSSSPGHAHPKIGRKIGGQRPRDSHESTATISLPSAEG